VSIVTNTFQFFFNKLINFRKRWIRRVQINGQSIEREDARLVKQMLANHLKRTNHAVIQQYEEEFARLNQLSFAFSFIKGRVALSACISALDLKPGDKVILPAYTCVVVANAFWCAGIDVHFCDIELDTFGLDFESVQMALSKESNLKAIVLQHSYGLVCRDFEKILHLAKENQLLTIEDCTHAFGSTFRGKPVGNWGDLAFFSSEHSKPFSTFCGGMAVTNNEQLAKNLSAFQTRTPFPDHHLTTTMLQNVLFNYYRKRFNGRPFLYRLFTKKLKRERISTTTKEEINGEKPADYLQKMPQELARLGLLQLHKIESIWQKRRLRTKYWTAWVATQEFHPPHITPESDPILLRYPILVSEEMKKNHSWANDLRVEIGVWFISPLHPSNIDIGRFPNAEKAVKCCINLPTLW